mmetsp:Transcript_56691/g.88211  ORF Transcript_56691/g.88211 Transcript_56691/m.88211 type:complete len:584 (-) Transcript_56691:73-1824(-)
MAVIIQASSLKCPICFECFKDAQSGQWITLSCGHGFDQNCLFQAIQIAVNDMGQIPACPLASDGCQHRINLCELEDVLSRRRSRDQGEDLETKTLHRFRLLEQHVGLTAVGAFPCVACPEWMVPSSPGAMERVVCPSCSEAFCARCRRRPFHYGCTCEEVDGICESWRKWASGHGVVLHDLEERMKEYRDMEAWKAKRCRLCPKCGRAVERISGCDHMVCGRNTEGGKNSGVQDGCGAKFDWSKAPRYKTSGTQHLEKLSDKAITLPEGFSARAHRARWPLVEGLDNEFERCDACMKDIVGPKFVCVNCPHLSLCSTCVWSFTSKRQEPTKPSCQRRSKTVGKAIANVKAKAKAKTKAKVKAKMKAKARAKVMKSAGLKRDRVNGNSMRVSVSAGELETVDAEAIPTMDSPLSLASAQGHRLDHVFRICWREPGLDELSATGSAQAPLSGKRKTGSHDSVAQTSSLNNLRMPQLTKLLRDQLAEWGQTEKQMRDQMELMGLAVEGGKRQQLVALLQAMGSSYGGSSSSSSSDVMIATNTSDIPRDKIDMLIGMGFPTDVALWALRKASGNTEQALEELLPASR